MASSSPAFTDTRFISSSFLSPPLDLSAFSSLSLFCLLIASVIFDWAITVATVALGRELIIPSSRSQSGLTEGGKMSEFLSFLFGPECESFAPSPVVSGLFLFLLRLGELSSVWSGIGLLWTLLMGLRLPAFLALSTKSAVSVSGSTLVMSVSPSLSSEAGSIGNSPSLASV